MDHYREGTLDGLRVLKDWVSYGVLTVVYCRLRSSVFRTVEPDRTTCTRPPSVDGALLG